MRTLLRRLLVLTASVVTVLVLVALVVVPVAAAALGPTLLRNAGVHSQQLTVRMNTGLDFLTGVVDSLTISSGPLTLDGRFRSADATIILDGVNLTNNTFERLEVSANEPVATMASGEVVTARWLRGSGPANAIVAQARFRSADLRAMVALPAVAKRLGLTITDLSLGDGVVTLQTLDGPREARLSVDAAGRLSLALDGGAPKVLWNATGPDAADWQLTGVSIDPDGITASATFDGAAFLARYPSLRDLLGGFAPKL
jgi:hypothetical protein